MTTHESLAWPDGPAVVGKKDLVVSCPSCGGRLVLGRMHFAGMPVLVECRCEACGAEYWLDWPAGHALLHPTLIGASDGSLYFDSSEWYPRRLQRCLATRANPAAARMEVRAQRKSSDRAVVIDCVDFLYGHCLLKLAGGLSFARRDPTADVVVIVPKQLAWLVPADVAAIEVDVSFRAGADWIAGLDETVHEAVGAYRELVIAPAVSQPPLSEDDLARLLGSGFAPSKFWSSSDEQAEPVVTIVLREDRLWLGQRTPFAIRLARRVSPGTSRRLAAKHQVRCVTRMVEELRRLSPSVRFTAVGLGTTGALPSDVLDLRTTEMTDVREREWLKAYARSRVVVGVHGSNMLLPSALGGAVVDLLPLEKLRNITQDLVITGELEREPKLCLFRYRILPVTTEPRVVAATIASILAGADRHLLNVIDNRSTYTSVGWPRPVTWRRAAAR